MATRDEVQLVTFQLGHQEYALPIEQVVQVVRMVSITPVPEAPETVKGVIDVRGRVVPVIDLRKRFGLPSRPYTLSTHMLITRYEDHMLALVVDLVRDVLRVPASTVEPPSEIGSRIDDVSAVCKLGDHLLMILDLGRVIGFDGKGRLDRVVAQFSEQVAGLDGPGRGFERG